jgi:DNA polymerase V
MYALVDCNNFYASCERVFRPDLNGKPIVVLSNNDGCAIARSNEAKALGIPMGAPAYQFEKVFEEKGVYVFSANFALYGDMSHRVMDMLGTFTPDMEIYSIDEAFLSLKGFEHLNLQQYGLTMRKKVLKGTGIPISVGIAPTKALSKVANRIAKKFTDRTGGSYVIDNEEKRIKALKWLAVEDVWGIGRQHAKRLRNVGVNTAFDFTQLPEEWVRRNMAVVGLRLQKELKGEPMLELDVPQAKKNIATTRSFDSNYTQFEQLKERVSSFAVSCSEKLRKQKSCCNALMVFVHTNRHREDLAQYSRNIVIQLPFPTNSAIELSEFAVQALKQIFREGYAYKKAGVIVMDFTPIQNQQLNIFVNSNPKHGKLMQAVDHINRLQGPQKVRLATQDMKRIWKMKQEKLSPRYSTNLHDIITIKI